MARMAACALPAFILVLQGVFLIQGCGGGEEVPDAVVATTSAPDTAKAATPAPTAAPEEETTASPEEVVPGSEKTVAGSLEFTMTSAAAASVTAAFDDPSTKAEVSAAFASSLADGLPGIDADDILIKGISTSSSRRLKKERLLQAATLVVDYVIVLSPSVDETSIADGVAAVDTTAVTASVE